MISKRNLMSVHRWTGIVAGCFLGLQGLTGMSLVFHDELMEGLAPPSDTAGAPASLDGLVARTLHAHPNGRIVRITPPASAGRPTVVRVADGHDDLLFFSPGDGRLLRDAPAHSYAPEWLYDLHTRFLAGENGRWIIALDGLALLFMAVSGVWFWWPGRHRVQQSLKIPWTAALPRVIGSLHRFCGVFLCLFLGGMAATGIALALYDEVSGGLARITPVTAAPVYPVDTYAGSLRTLDAIRAEIATVAPGQRIKNLRFKTKDMRVVRAILEANGPNNWSKDWHVNQIWIDRADGRVLATESAAKDPAGSKLLAWLLPLHSGRAFGLAGRLFAVVLGLALSLFAGTGLWLWASRQFRKPVQRPG